MSLQSRLSDLIAAIGADVKELNGKIQSVPNPIERAMLYVYGHSYTVDIANAHTPGATYADRVISRDRMQSSRRGVGGDTIMNTWGRVTNGGANASTAWKPGSRGIVILDCMLNDVRRYGSDPIALAAYKQMLRSILYFLTAGQVTDETSGVVYSGTWTRPALQEAYGGFLQYTSAAGAYADITWTGDSCVIITYGLATGQAGGVTQVSVGGTIVGTYDLRNYLPAGAAILYAPFPIKLSGYGPGAHTARLTNMVAGGSGYVDAVLTPSATPPAILVMKDPVLANWALYSPFNVGSDAARNSYAAAVDEIVAEFPTAIAVDGNSGWDKTTMIASQDSVHPNDRGHARLADLVDAALKVKITDFVPGVHIA